MNCIESAYPLSKGRKKALAEFEDVLRGHYENLTSKTNAELKDAIHYTIFRLKDRLALSTAWIVAKELGLESTRTSAVFSGLEMVRCALGTFSLTSKQNSGFIDRALVEQSVLCLVSMSSELILNPNSNPEFTENERIEIAQLFGNTLSPLKMYSQQHDLFKNRNYPELNRFDEAEFSKLESTVVCPIFEAAGFMIDTILASKGDRLGRDKKFTAFFKRLGLLAFFVDELNPKSSSKSDFAQKVRLTSNETTTLIQTIESDLLQMSSDLGIEKAAVDFFHPLADIFEATLQ